MIIQFIFGKINKVFCRNAVKSKQREQWDEIREHASEYDEIVNEALAELDEWVKETFEEYDEFSILGL